MQFDAFILVKQYNNAII